MLGYRLASSLRISLIKNGLSVRSELLSSKASNNVTENFIQEYANIPALQNASEDIKKAYSLQFASKYETNKDVIAGIRKQLQLRDGDTGSAPVQVGILTVRIKNLTEHMFHNKKDKSTLRALLTMVHKRRKILKYLRQKDFERYHTLLSELQIRPIPDKKYAYTKKQQ